MSSESKSPVRAREPVSGMPFVLDNLEYVRDLGAGSEGKVVLVRDTGNGDHYALKYALKCRATDHEAYAAKELGECDTMVRVHKTGTVEGRHKRMYGYMVMDLHQGSVGDWTYDPQLEWDTDPDKQEWLNEEYMLKRMLFDISHAFDHMQKLGWIHRDVKPANMGILIRNGKSRVVLADLGFTRKIIDEEGKLIAAERRDFDSLTTWRFASPRTALRLPQYYVDDLGNLLMSIACDHFVKRNAVMFGDNPKQDKAFAGFDFLADPQAALNRMRVRSGMDYFQKIPEWYKHAAVLAREQMKNNPTGSVDYRRILDPLVHELREPDPSIKPKKEEEADVSMFLVD